MKLVFSTVSVAFFISITLNSFASSSKRIKKVEQVKKTNITDSLTKDSIFKNSLIKVSKKHSSFSKKALINAYSFLDQNYKALKADNLCFSSNNKKNRTKIRNLNCMIVVDYSSAKVEPRLLFINPLSGDSELFLSAHGKGSNKPEERETGLKTIRYSNISGSNMTSLGFYLTDFLITSKKNTFGPGPNNGLMLDGINCTNNNARKRQIVAHTAMYVPEIKAGTEPKVGNSEGCVTLPSTRKDILKSCEHGALVYAYDDPKKHLEKK